MMEVYLSGILLRCQIEVSVKYPFSGDYSSLSAHFSKRFVRLTAIPGYSASRMEWLEENKRVFLAVSSTGSFHPQHNLAGA
jgi:hypothetical protein